MSNYSSRIGIKLTSRRAEPAVLKLLRGYFPEQSLAVLKQKIESGDYLYLSDEEKYAIDGRKLIAKLLRDFDRLKLSAELYEERRHGSVWEVSPVSRTYLFNTLQRYQTVARQVTEEMEREEAE